jgi:hypothetical protein
MGKGGVGVDKKFWRTYIALPKWQKRIWGHIEQGFGMSERKVRNAAKSKTQGTSCADRKKHASVESRSENSTVDVTWPSTSMDEVVQATAEYGRIYHPRDIHGQSHRSTTAAIVRRERLSDNTSP